MRRRNGFTLIELLVVIAIIGILAAIIFPVYAQAKKSAYKSSDLSNMNSLRTALQLYKTDNGSYPPALLGFVGPYQNVSNGTILPPNSIREALYPRRVDSLSTVRPALHRISDSLPAQAYVPSAIEAGNNPLVTPALWPKGILFADTNNRSNQRFGPANGFVRRAVYNPQTGACSADPNYYYRISGYDAAPNGPGSTAPYETHYQLFWSAWAVPANPCSPTPDESGSASDTPRQLGYSEPPETTVVTWNGFFRDYVNGAPQNQKQDLVLFLGGSARPMNSATMAAQAWAVTP